MGEVPGDVGEYEVLRTYELDGRPFEHGVVFFADKSGVFDGFLDDVVYVLCLFEVSGKSFWRDKTNAQPLLCK